MPEPIDSTIFLDYNSCVLCTWFVTNPGRKRPGFVLKEADNRVSTIVFSNEGESVDSLLRRFNRKVQQDGVLSEARRRERTRKQIAARRQASKAARANSRTGR
jgi:small subunit ribosomal protein S21